MKRKLGLITALVVALGCGSLALAASPNTSKTASVKAATAAAPVTAKRRHRRSRKHRRGGMKSGGNMNANMTPKK